jgi:hypothetical protein
MAGGAVQLTPVSANASHEKDIVPTNEEDVVNVQFVVTLVEALSLLRTVM